MESRRVTMRYGLMSACLIMNREFDEVRSAMLHCERGFAHRTRVQCAARQRSCAPILKPIFRILCTVAQSQTPLQVRDLVYVRSRGKVDTCHFLGHVLGVAGSRASFARSGCKKHGAALSFCTDPLSAPQSLAAGCKRSASPVAVVRGFRSRLVCGNV